MISPLYDQGSHSTSNRKMCPGFKETKVSYLRCKNKLLCDWTVTFEFLETLPTSLPNI